MSGATRIGLFTDVYSSTATNLPASMGRVEENEYGDRFMFVRQLGATSSAVGEWAAQATTIGRGAVSRTAATSCINGVETIAPAVGVFQSILAVNQYGWVQISGVGVTTIAVTDGGVAQGDFLIIDGGNTPVGACESGGAGEEMCCCGWALADDTGTTLLAGNYTIRSIYT